MIIICVAALVLGAIVAKREAERIARENRRWRTGPCDCERIFGGVEVRPSATAQRVAREAAERRRAMREGRKP